MKLIILITKVGSILTLIILFFFLIHVSFKQGLADVCQLQAQSEKLTFNKKQNFLNAAIKLDPKNTDLHETLGQLYLDEVSEPTTNKSKFLKNSVASFQQAIQLNPTNYKYHLFLAHTHFKLNKNSEGFMEKLVMIEKLNPHNEIISKYKNQFHSKD